MIPIYSEIFRREYAKAIEERPVNKLFSAPDPEREPFTDTYMVGRMFIQVYEGGDLGDWSKTAARNFVELLHRLWCQVVFGITHHELLPYVPAALDGKMVLSRDERFLAEGGNYVGRFDGSVAILYDAQRRALQYRDLTEEPLVDGGLLDHSEWTVGFNPVHWHGIKRCFEHIQHNRLNLWLSQRFPENLGVILADYDKPPIVLKGTEPADLHNRYDPRKKTPYPTYAPPNGIEARAEYTIYVRPPTNLFWFEF